MRAVLFGLSVLLLSSHPLLAQSATTTPAACEALQKLQLDGVALTITTAAGVPASTAPTTPLSDVVKLPRSSAICFPMWRVIIAPLTQSYDGSSRGSRTVEGERRRHGEEDRRDRQTESRHRFAGSNVSVRLKNGITCSWKRTATSLVCVPA